MNPLSNVNHSAVISNSIDEEKTQRSSSIEFIDSLSSHSEKEGIETLTHIANGSFQQLAEAHLAQSEASLKLADKKVSEYKCELEISLALCVLSYVASETMEFLTNVIQLEDDETIRAIGATSSALAFSSGIYALYNWQKTRRTEALQKEILKIIEEDQNAPKKIRRLLKLIDELQEQSETEDLQEREGFTEERKQENLVEECLKEIPQLPNQVFGQLLPSKETFLNTILSLCKWREVASILGSKTPEETVDIEAQSSVIRSERNLAAEDSVHFEDKGQNAPRMKGAIFIESNPSISPYRSWQKLEEKLSQYGLSLPRELRLKDMRGIVHTIENPLRATSSSRSILRF
jgi:hypothetical protein